MSFKYSVEHIDFNVVHAKEDLLLLLKEHDPDSFHYCVYTGQLNYAIGVELGLDTENLNILFECGLFHDTGKLGMEYNFINYPGAYTIEMYSEMKKHTAGGGLLLEKVNAHKEIVQTAKYHHCNFDGSGYPGGFYYDEIPLFARVTRISDSVDAYMSKRCYKDGGPTNEVYDDLMQYSGTSYDPELLEAFLKVHKNVMKMCHKDGFDRPSKDVYMHFLKTIYCKNFKNEVVEKLDLKF